MFPLIGHRRHAVRIVVLVALGAAALALPSRLLVFRWLFLFELGIVAFYLEDGIIGVPEYAAGVALAAGGVYATLGPEVAVVGVATTLLIAFVVVRSRALLFLGDLSYSLYLVHVPVGGAVINAGTRLRLGPLTATVLALTAVGLSIAVAHAFHRLIERPARTWAGRVAYGAEPAAAQPSLISATIGR